MIRAVVTWASGNSDVVFSETWSELFEQLGEYARYIALEAREIEKADCNYSPFPAGMSQAEYFGLMKECRP